MSLVLIVDDEPDVRLMLRMALSIAGHDIDEAGTGDEALQAVAATDYDAIVLDIHLPDMLGWDVLDRMRASADRWSTPVVVVTADVSQGDHLANEHLGDFTELIYKPMDPDHLVDALERALARS